MTNDPKPTPTPITGELSSKPLLGNTWGGIGDNTSLHYHDDGPVGTAVKYMGQDARMDVDGEPLANVVGRIATDVVHRKTKAQQAVNELKELRDRLPEGSRAKMCLSQAVRNMDGPDTLAPQVPEGTPEVLRNLVTKLHAVPMVRREPEKELQPLLEICGRAAAGDKRAALLMDDEVKRLRNKRHESLGDCGKFEIDDAVNDAVMTMKEQRQQPRQQEPQREQRGTTTTFGNTQNYVGGEVRGSQLGTVNGGLTFHADTGKFTIGGNQRQQGDVTPPPAPRPKPHRPEAAVAKDNSSTGPVVITDGRGNPILQAGDVRGGVWVDGKRIK